MRPILPMLIMLLLASCQVSLREPHVNFKADFKRNVWLKDLCDSIECVMLNTGEHTDFIIPTMPRYSVYDGVLCVLDSTSTRIGLFRPDGNLDRIYDVAEPVMDFYLYKHQLIQVLTRNGIKEISLQKDTWYLRKNLAESDITYRAIARRDNNVICLIGDSGTRAYDNELIISKDRFYPSVNPVCTADDVYIPRFFEDKDSLYYYYSDRRTILYYTSDDFIRPILEFKFKFPRGLDPHSFSFINAQKFNQNFYINIRNGQDTSLFVYNRSTGQRAIIKKTRDGIKFPLGCISNGINYAIITGEEIEKYASIPLLKVRKDSMPLPALLVIKMYLRDPFQ